ncbi:MAG: type I-E CRISPR-associated protein Cas7/Cse4/CasC [Bacteroidota bacterium]
MSRFLQLHLLTSYPPSNPNRDDLGQPKTARIGGHLRQRVSSQSLKRAWRTSEAFREELGAGEIELSDGFREALLQSDLNVERLHAHLGIRTKDLGIATYRAFEAGGMEDEKQRRAWTEPIVTAFAKRARPNTKTLKENPLADLQTGQLVLFSAEELKAVDELVTTLIGRKDEKDAAPTKEELDLLREDHAATDLALFGRMLADKSRFSGEAAAQVAHAFTVDVVKIEDDFFTAVDDLNLSPRTDAEDEDRGAAHLGEVGYGSGVYYVYACIDCESLRDNLSGAEDADTLRDRALKAFAHAALTVTPSGKRNTFAHHTYAHVALAERGDQQPRSLAVAFLSPVESERGGKSPLDVAAERLKATWEHTDTVYGACADDRYVLDNRPPPVDARLSSDGTRDGFLDFVAGGSGNVTAPGNA